MIINRYIQSLEEDATSISLEKELEDIGFKPINLNDLREAIRKTLTPEEYNTWLENMDKTNIYDDQPCLIDAFFQEQQKLSPQRRTNVCMISCPCPKCKVGTL